MIYTLHLHNICNMNCSYCYVDKNTPELNEDRLERSVYEFYSLFNSGYNTIELLGGEKKL